ncbi:MAG: AMP-binding protein [Alphaproteobacteria bacterium]
MSNTASRFRWIPSEDLKANAKITQFMRALGVPDYDTLKKRADADVAWFYDALLRYINFRFYQPYDKIVDLSRGAANAQWCVGGVTNFVLNCLDKHRGTPTWNKTYLLWEGEDGRKREYTYAEFDAEVCRFANALRGLGYGKGDVISLYLPMIPETFIAFFGIIKIGAICMPLFSGFGEAPLLTRLNEGAKAVVTVDGTWRRGQPGPMKSVLDVALAQAPSVKHVFVVRHLGDALPVTMTKGRDLWWHDVVAGQPTDARTEPMPANAPAVLLFTSGTTGKPKGAIYDQVGFIAKQALDMGLCTDFRDTDRYMFLSDMGWMVGAMTAVIPSFHGGSFVVAEGAPDYPDSDRFWRLADSYGVSYLGLAPTVVRTLMRYPIEEVRRYHFDKLRIIFSGGEAWTETPWSWLFENVCKRRVPILNGSGGTECGGCIVVGTLLHPLKPGSIAGPVPGMGTDVVDDGGKTLGPNQVGELVLRVPSIGLTRGLWNDPEGARFRETYWENIPGLWVHGDWTMYDEDGLWYVLGRSDDTIKISGKRTGPSEIEGLLMETGQVSDVAAIGIPDPIKGSTLICVCVPMPGVTVDASLQNHMAEAVTKSMGRSYRPKAVVFVSDLPRTRNMKIMRRVVRAVFTGKEPGDLSALVNPEAVAALKTIATREGLG